jgi:YHS domain-containing protein
MTRWILTAIAVLLLLRLVLRFVLGLFQGLTEPAGTSPRRQGAAGGVKMVGALVQDPVCGMYIPRETAIVASVGGETRHYCSTACRDKDAASRPQPRVGRAAHG